MHLSTRGRYAVMAMIDLATLQTQTQEGATTTKPVTLAQIAERQDLSLSYLEQLFAKLRRANLVKSVRGPGGGYLLSAETKHIWLAQIIAAVDEEVDLTRCGTPTKGQKKGDLGCVKGQQCNAHNIWVALGQNMMHFLSKISLEMAKNNTFSLPTANTMPNKTRVHVA